MISTDFVLRSTLVSDDATKFQFRSFSVAPTIEPLSDMEVLEETSLKVVCNTQGLPSPDVVWFHTSAGRARVVATSRILVVKSIEVSQNGAYHCSAKNYMGKAEQSLQIKVFRKYTGCPQKPKTIEITYC
jgi:hypothetical protein